MREPSREYDAVVIGAGVAGIYQLYRLRELGMRVHAFEAGSGPGGAWYWNRYPGARFDSESYSYAYSFSKEILDEWNWSEHFASQPEVLRYYDFVVDRLDLRPSITFNSLVVSAQYDEHANRWRLTLDDGSSATAQFVVAAVGPLTVPTLPRIDGVESFAGEAYHTARWPREPVTFAGKRVGVIGTGATGVQTIQEAAKTARHLTVFQRTANYCAPLNNRPITEAEQPALKATYDEVFTRCATSGNWFIHDTDPRGALSVSDEERLAFFEKLYGEPGLGIWQGNFRDTMTDAAANRTITEFIHAKIRERVEDPVTAEKLIPKDHGFGNRRVPLETGYYEVFNQPNVDLVDLKATPIVRITPTGVQTTEGLVELDMLVYATGFDAITGSFDRIDIRGLDGRTLKDTWAEGPRAYLGLQISGFPNFFTPGGPLSALGNIPRALEYHVNWITDVIVHMRKHGFNVVDARPEAEAAWTDHAREVAQIPLSSKIDSWMTGVNTNVEGKQARNVVMYRGGAANFRTWCENSSAGGYPELAFGSHAETQAHTAALPG
ncbi:NAD(P)/FAD-dependent oxidoreductase [Acuticoccus sp. I52.16.1]|uniref:flavin-containing monooxygenase n=1 Tax=Acuticoccus sp. I52.16.1 TaxID=2928472 RepID=UPI001FCFD87B|nr:NAD(P)/FAD-dependent oxidoreductase [Acuticoccus sp. I52.16.1]UOM36568.1 NAD(P)/FAD-dependent oxidoreductase [Acuticoccus sp. I52.16.1]